MKQIPIYGRPNQTVGGNVLGVIVAHAIIDDADYDSISNLRWNISRCRNTSYAKSGIIIDGTRKAILMHRLLCNPPKGLQIDHINHNGLDNRRENLRIVSHRGNTQNRTRLAQKLPCGVSKANSSRNGYQARIRVDGKYIHIGVFKTAEEARRAYVNECNRLGLGCLL